MVASGKVSDPNKLRELLNARASRSKNRTGSRDKVILRDNKTGRLVFTESLPTNVSVGSFSGRAGSLRRSSKGRTYRLANGSRRYFHDKAVPGLSYPPDLEVVSYKP